MAFEEPLVHIIRTIMGPKRQVVCLPSLEERDTHGSFARWNGGSVLLLSPHVQYAMRLLAIHGTKYAAWNLQDGGRDFLNDSVDPAYM